MRLSYWERQRGRSTWICNGHAALADPDGCSILVSGQGRLLATKGFLSAMPACFRFGLTVCVHRAAFSLPSDISTGRKKASKCAWVWVIAVFLIPNFIGFIPIFLSEAFSFGLAVPVASLFAGEKTSAATADTRKVLVVSNASRKTITMPEDGMKRERAPLQAVLVLVGLLYCFWVYLSDNL